MVSTCNEGFDIHPSIRCTKVTEQKIRDANFTLDIGR